MDPELHTTNPVSLQPPTPLPTDHDESMSVSLASPRGTITESLVESDGVKIDRDTENPVVVPTNSSQVNNVEVVKEVEKKAGVFYSRREAELLQKIFHFIVQNQPEIIKLYYGRVKPTAHNDLSSCFVNLSFSQETTFPLMSYIIKDEFETNSRTQVLLRENCIASKIIKTYLEKIGRDYLIEILAKQINSIVSNDRRSSFEIDPSKVEKEEAERNRQSLEIKAVEFLNTICAPESIEKMPIGIRIIALFVAQQSIIHLPDQVNIMIGSFLFLRYLNPAIFSPESIEGLLFKVKVPSAVSRRNLVLITKVLQNLANEKRFGEKEIFMKPLDSFITKHKATIAEYFKRVTDFQYNPSVVHDLSVYDVSDDDLQYFHILLFQNLDVEDQFKDRAHTTEFHRLLEKLGSYNCKKSITELEEPDQRMVRTMLEQRNEEAAFVCYVDLIEKKRGRTDKTVRNVLIIGRYKVILFRPKEGTRTFKEYHQLDLLKIVSEKSNELMLSFKTLAGESVLNCTAENEKVDDIIDTLRRSHAYVFHNPQQYTLIVKPDSRLRHVNTHLTDDTPCCGLGETYKALCDYYEGVAVNSNVCNAINQFYGRNRVLHFNRFTMLSEDPLSDKDAQPLFHALGFNTYFTSLIVKHMKFDKTTLEALTKMLSINSSIASLTLADTSLRERSHTVGFFTLFEAMSNNPHCALTALDLSNTAIDNRKDKEQLAHFLSRIETNFVKLDLSQQYSRSEKNPTVKSEKSDKDDGLKGVLTALSMNPVFADHLAILNLGGNKLDRSHVDALCGFLKKATSIEVLQLAGTNLSLGLLISGLFSQRCSESLCKLDLANQKQTKVKEWDVLLQWLESPNVCSLEYLDISNTQIPLESFLRILQHKNKNRYPGENGLSLRAAKNSFGKEAGVAIGGITKNIISVVSLDLADNFLGDEGVQSLVEGLYHNRCIHRLNINRNFRFQNYEKRNRLIQFLVEMLGSKTLKLESLMMAGANKGTNKDSRLKEHITTLISSLASNVHLTALDISGHACGTPGAIALARMLEVNQSLLTLHWDDNNVGLVGFQHMRKSLKLNNALQEMPLPLSDIAKLLNVHGTMTAMVPGGGSGVEKEGKQELMKAVEGIEKCLRRNQQY